MRNEKLLALGAKIRFERIKKGFSQEELAEKTGLSRRAISCIESGANNPKYLTLLCISDALNITLKDLLETKF